MHKTVCVCGKLCDLEVFIYLFMLLRTRVTAVNFNHGKPLTRFFAIFLHFLMDCKTQIGVGENKISMNSWKNKSSCLFMAFCFTLKIFLATAILRLRRVLIHFHFPINYLHEHHQEGAKLGLPPLWLSDMFCFLFDFDSPLVVSMIFTCIPLIDLICVVLTCVEVH